MKIKSDNKILFENFIALVLTQVVTYAIPLITLPYLSRVLGAEKFGLVFWADSVIKYFFILTDFGFCISAVREISIHRNNKDKVNQIFSSIMFIKFVLIIISFLILTVMILTIPKFKNELLLFYLSFFMVIGNALYPIWFFQGIEHMKYVTFLKIISQSIFLILIFILVKTSSDYVLVALLNAIGFVLSSFVGLWCAYKRFGLKLVKPTKKEILYQLKYSSEFFSARVAGAGYTNTNAFIIGLISSPVLVAFYSAAEKIYSAVQCLSAPIGNVLYPYIAKNRDIVKYKKVFFPSIIILVFISLFIFIFAKDIIAVFYGSELIPAYKVLRIFCITVLFSFVSSLVGFPLLAGMGYTKDANRPIVIGFAIHLTFLALLLFFRVLNIYTIAFSVLLTELFVVTYRICKIIKNKIWNINYKEA